MLSVVRGFGDDGERSLRSHEVHLLITESRQVMRCVIYSGVLGADTEKRT